MKTKQEAEREEQQRIKNLVLNYDLGDDQHDGTILPDPIFQRPLDKSAYAKVLPPRSRSFPVISRPRGEVKSTPTKSETTQP